MCAHIQGQLLNASKLGTSLGVTNHTIMNYLEILEETFMIRLLRPYHENIKKRLVKSPKVYVRDSGIVHSLLSIEEFNDLLGHPICGFSFEGFIIENLIKLFPKHQPYFYRTAVGDELDLLLVKGSEKLAFEIKASTAPEVEDGFWKVLKDLKPTKTFIIANVDSSFIIRDRIEVVNLEYMISYVKDKG
jgi:predicted AAA+ superfamily ATPase